METVDYVALYIREFRIPINCEYTEVEEYNNDLVLHFYFPNSIQAHRCHDHCVYEYIAVNVYLIFCTPAKVVIKFHAKNSLFSTYVFEKGLFFGHRKWYN